ncbi:MAG: hypothetical protein WDA75_12105 [Candidatus Latescibacterota bacterium]
MNQRCRGGRVWLLVALVCSGCESDPSKDSGTNGTRVPTLPTTSTSAGSGLNHETVLNGQYARAVRIEPATWAADGPGQEISLTFSATGMRNVKQFRLRIQAEPAEAFVLASSRFTSRDPFFVPGIDLPGATGLVETGAAILGTQRVEGDGLLGTLTLITGPSFTAATRVSLRVVLFSIGSTSTNRDEYAADDLNLGVQVNGP